MQMFRNSIYLTSVMLVLALAGVFAFAATDVKDVPNDVGEKIQHLQLDRSQQMTTIIQLEAQYQGAQAAMSNDQKEIDKLVDQAIKDAGLDKDSWSVDLTNCCPMHFLEKPKPASNEQPKTSK